MTKFFSPHKGATSVLLGVFFSVMTYAQNIPSVSVQDGLTSARELMLQGKRKLAIENLQNAWLVAKTKIEQKEIAAKRSLYADQFITAGSFQKFREAKNLFELKRWDECVRELDSVDAKDKDNAFVLTLKAQCLFELKQFDPVNKTLDSVLAMKPGDVNSLLMKAEACYFQNQFAQGQALVEMVDARDSNEIEKKTILKARLVEGSGDAEKAIKILKTDQDLYLEHVAVIYELGMVYSRMPGMDWYARKSLSLFLQRLKRFKDTEIKGKGFDSMQKTATDLVAQLDKKLGV